MGKYMIEVIKIHHEVNFAKNSEKFISKSMTSRSERLSLDLASRTFETLPKSSHRISLSIALASGLA
jgi:hypothetical protein